MTTKKIDLNNFLFIIYNFNLTIKLNKLTYEERIDKIKQMYVDRVLSDYPNDIKSQNKLLSLKNTSVDFYIRDLNKTYEIIDTNKLCCCLFK